jgi:tetratricopeptide (TPR) repeat protein
MVIKLRQGHTKFLIIILTLLAFNIMIFQEIFVPMTCYAARFSSGKNTVDSGKMLYENGLITRKTARKEEDLEKAIKKFKEAIKGLKEDDPLRREINFQLGYSYYLLGNYSEAKDYFDKGKPYKRKELEEKAIAPKIISFAVAPRSAELDREKKKDEKPWYKKWYWWALIVAVVGGGTAAAVSSGGGGNGDSSDDSREGGSDSIPVRW